MQLFAERLDFDIFGDLVFDSDNLNYNANLKKDIFDNLIYTDNFKNKITYEKKYIDLVNPTLLNDKEAKKIFFRQLIYEFRKKIDFEATYSIDIFDNLIIKDNQNNSIKMGKDIFGNSTYEETRNNKNSSIKKDLTGKYEYKSDNAHASLSKDMMNKWIYEDSSGNKFEFSEKAWDILKHRFDSDENIILYLVNDFLINCHK